MAATPRDRIAPGAAPPLPAGRPLERTAHAEAPPIERPPPSPIPALETPLAFATMKDEARILPTEEAGRPRTPLPLLVDVTPLSLSVETVSGYRDVIIPRNSPVPCEQSRAFVTSRQGQTTVHVRVGQGESERFADDTLLGEVELSGLRAAGRGEVHVIVTFALDTDGMLEVSARDSETGQDARAKLRLIGLPEPGELQRMASRHLAERSR